MQKELKNLRSIPTEPRFLGLSKSHVAAKNYLEYCITKLEHQNDKVKPGDIFYTSWGYDQTNSDFYKVVEVSKTGKTCQVIGIQKQMMSQDGTNGSITAIPETQITKKSTVKIGRSISWNERKKQKEQIGEIILRGSVYDQHDGKSLHSLYKYNPEKNISVSWGH